MFSILTVMLLSAQAAGSTPSVSTACDKLAALALPNTTITSAQLVPAGPFTTPDLKALREVPLHRTRRREAAARPPVDADRALPLRKRCCQRTAACGGAEAFV